MLPARRLTGSNRWTIKILYDAAVENDGSIYGGAVVTWMYALLVK